MSAQLPLLSVRDLSVSFETRAGRVRAVNKASFDVEENQTVALVGESGSGKSVTGLALMGLVPSPPGVVEGGRVFFEEENLLLFDEARMRRLRGAQVSLVFQDPMTSLNPFLSIGEQLREVLQHKKGLTRREASTASAIGLGDVGIPNPEAMLHAHPHELSGGMRQRVMIAMALLCRPKLLIADEPTTALDVTIQAQILELLRDLQERHGMSILLITHDLGVVAGMADRLLVMYAGSIVEMGSPHDLFARPGHPYTKGLLGAVPRLDQDPTKPLATIDGQPPDLALLSAGCAFTPRCPYREVRCERERPILATIAHERGRAAACFARVRVRDGIAPPYATLTDTNDRAD